MNHPRVSIRRKLIFATLAPLCVAILLCWLIGSLNAKNRLDASDQWFINTSKRSITCRYIFWTQADSNVRNRYLRSQ